MRKVRKFRLVSFFCACSDIKTEALSTAGIIEKPALLIVADRDPVGVPSVQLNGNAPYAVNLHVRSLDSGHFVQVEQAREVNLHLESFFEAVLNGNFH